MRIRSIPLFLAMGLLAGHALSQVPWAGYWKLDEKTGTTAADSSPFKNDGTLQNFTGNPWVPGKIGNALSFDGIDDYVWINVKKALPIYKGLGSPYSITFWVKAPLQSDKRVYSEGSSLSNRPIFTLGSGYTSLGHGDKLRVYIRNDAGHVFAQVSKTIVFDDKWHHVAWVDVSGKGVVYVDGVRDGADFDYSFRAYGTRSRDYGPFTMDRVALGGVLRASTCCFLKGIIDDFRIYRFALSAADVKTVMKGGHPKWHGSAGRFGVGCGAGPLALSGGGTGVVGKPIPFQLSRGTPLAMGFLLFGAPIRPLDLSPLGFQGCVLYPAGARVLPVGALNPAGVSNLLVLPVPNDPSLVGSLFGFQGMAVFSGPPVGLELSEVLLVQFGP